MPPPEAKVDEPLYTMTLDLSVLDHLGLNLYSNMPAVLSEAVANAWDADATQVDIVIDAEAQVITITDDGLGMDRDDINQKFLAVGYRRREEEKVKTPKYRRHVMGRKGIGKLSLFSIADRIEIHSVKTNIRGRPLADPSGLVLETGEIRKAINARTSYHPAPVVKSNIKIKVGTRLELDALKTHATETTRKALRTRLARRFSIIGDRFKVTVNGDPITIEDRDYFGKIEYLWSIGDVGNRYAKLATNAKRKERLDGTVDEDAGYTVSGWVGTFDEQKSIEDENNAVSILAWGKLVQEDILSDIRAGGLYTKYLMGEIRADFVDLDNKDDIATSDRQSLKETDPRYQQLREFVQTKILPSLEKNWRDWRRDDGLKKALAEPAVEAWYSTLDGTPQKFAKQLFGRIGRMAADDDETRRTLYKHGILAFERLRYKESLSELSKIEGPADLALVSEFVQGLDDVEAGYYHQIVQGRLAVIQQFIDVVDHEKEKVIQRHLFDHLWLLHPSWERASTNARIEEGVTKEFDKLDARLTAAEKAGRVDIRYRTAAGKNIIIELKKYNRTITVGKLVDQLQKYRTALKKVVAKFPDEPQGIEVIAILGRPITGSTDEEAGRMLTGINARVILYDQLIKEAQESYKDYLEANKELSKVAAILDQLE